MILRRNQVVETFLYLEQVANSSIDLVISMLACGRAPRQSWFANEVYVDLLCYVMLCSYLVYKHVTVKSCVSVNVMLF